MIVSSLFIVPMKKFYYIYYFINILLNHNNDKKLKTKRNGWMNWFVLFTKLSPFRIFIMFTLHLLF